MTPSLSITCFAAAVYVMGTVEVCFTVLITRIELEQQSLQTRSLRKGGWGARGFEVIEFTLIIKVNVFSMRSIKQGMWTLEDEDDDCDYYYYKCYFYSLEAANPMLALRPNFFTM